MSGWCIANLFPLTSRQRLACMIAASLMDFFGSGPGWAIYYYWPFSRSAWDNRIWSWAFYSWQNITTAIVFLAWTIAIAIRAGRTPRELLMPNLDRQLVAWLRKRRLWRLPKAG